MMIKPLIAVTLVTVLVCNAWCRTVPINLKKKEDVHKSDVNYLIPETDYAGLTLRQSGVPTAFSVTLDKSQVISTGNVIRFDNVITNVGNSFNIKTGEFTAPQSGIYFFSLNAVCGAHSYMHLAISRNGLAVFKTLCDDRTGSTQHQGGGATILQLGAGEKISVRMTFPLNAQSELYGRGMTSFTGYRVA
ncbi:complement C1q subcomponent subunit B-like isoform X2 [Dreissena polymorpha]|nr:complement C1q subcomponent subunit B-like isoform X2 [Dreissena polymorpha]